MNPRDLPLALYLIAFRAGDSSAGPVDVTSAVERIRQLILTAQYTPEQ